jgi:hypothetical protein
MAAKNKAKKKEVKKQKSPITLGRNESKNTNKPKNVPLKTDVTRRVY